MRFCELNLQPAALHKVYLLKSLAAFLRCSGTRTAGRMGATGRKRR